MYKKVIAFISAFLMVVSLVGCGFEPKREVSEKEYGVGGAHVKGFADDMVGIEIHTTPDIEEIEDTEEFEEDNTLEIDD